MTAELTDRDKQLLESGSLVHKDPDSGVVTIVKKAKAPAKAKGKGTTR